MTRSRRSRTYPRLGLSATGWLLVACLASAVGVAQGSLVDQVLSRCGDKPYSYDELMTTLKQLDQNERVWTAPIGQSGGGRTIPIVAVHHPQTVFGQTARLFIVARQHGTEVAGTEAVMALIWHLAQSNSPSDIELLRRVTFAVVPMANPDGAVARQRLNSGGFDLNRDWASLSQPETRAVEWAFRVWRPHTFIDCHELPAESSKAAYQCSFVETIADDPALDGNMTQLCSFLSDNVRRYETAYGSRLNVYYDSHESDRRLAHRHFGLDYSTPSFLFESKTGAGYSMRDRIRFHIVGILVIANLLAQRVAVPTPSVPAPPTIPLPQAPTIPPAQRLQLAAKTDVRFAEPSRDRQSYSQEIPLRVEVQPSADFAYISLHVDGIMRAITDAAPYEAPLSVEGFTNGTHTIVCRAHDNTGRVIAAAERLVVVNNAVAGP
jgi:hypothetical protein